MRSVEAASVEQTTHVATGLAKPPMAKTAMPAPKTVDALQDNNAKAANVRRSPLVGMASARLHNSKIVPLVLLIVAAQVEPFVKGWHVALSIPAATAFAKLHKMRTVPLAQQTALAPQAKHAKRRGLR